MLQQFACYWKPKWTMTKREREKILQRNRLNILDILPKATDIKTTMRMHLAKLRDSDTKRKEKKRHQVAVFIAFYATSRFSSFFFSIYALHSLSNAAAIPLQNTVIIVSKSIDFLSIHHLHFDAILHLWLPSFILHKATQTLSDYAKNLLLPATV